MDQLTVSYSDESVRWSTVYRLQHYFEKYMKHSTRQGAEQSQGSVYRCTLALARRAVLTTSILLSALMVCTAENMVLLY